MSDARSTAVEADILLRLVAPEPMVVRARFRYDSTDPYAVHVRFYTEPDAPAVTWTLARELLATGLDQPAGIGDVRVWPSLRATPEGDLVIIVLSSPDGHSLLEAPRKAVFRFLRRSYALVARGEEASYQDLDAALGRLLDG